MPQQSSEINCRIECQSKAVNSTRGALYRPRFCLTALHRAWVGQREEERETEIEGEIYGRREIEIEVRFYYSFIALVIHS